MTFFNVIFSISSSALTVGGHSFVLIQQKSYFFKNSSTSFANSLEMRKVHRDVLRALSYIYDGVSLENSERLKFVNFFLLKSSIVDV